MENKSILKFFFQVNPVGSVETNQIWFQSLKTLFFSSSLVPLQNKLECFSLFFVSHLKVRLNLNGAACFKNANNCLNNNIYSYLVTSGGQSCILYLNVVHFFNTSVN